MRPALPLLALVIALAVPAAAQPSPEALASRVLASTPLIDGHNDWPWALRTHYGLEKAKTADLVADPTVRQPQPGHTSIPLLRQGMVGAQIWSVYVPMRLRGDEAVRTSFEQIDLVKALLARHPETFAFATTADGIVRAFRRGRIASLLGMEGAHQVNDDIATLRRAHAAGVRSMTLTHSQPSALFDSATADPKHNGIAPGAAAMIAEMNRLGMLVDLSHVSPAVMHAVLDITKAPVIFSHSSAKAVTNHPRNVPDDVLKRLPANGGVVMVTFVPGFISQARADWEGRRAAQALLAGQGAEAQARMRAWEKANPRPATTLAQVADHIDHVAKVAGHDHVGIGGDYDGVPDLPQGLETVATYPALFAELARRGWSEANLRKLAGENFLRVLRANERTAAALRKADARRNAGETAAARR
ncbi:MAG: dipeptidase [Sphingomonadaceae bacterium]